MNFKTATLYAKDILTHRANPSYLADLQIEIAAYYSYLNDMKADLKIARAQFWVDEKERGEKSKSDEMMKMLWLLTEKGQREQKITTALDSIEKLLSAIKSSIYTAGQELKNQI